MNRSTLLAPAMTHMQASYTCIEASIAINRIDSGGTRLRGEAEKGRCWLMCPTRGGSRRICDVRALVLTSLGDYGWVVFG